MNAKIILGILLAGILSNNYALLHFLGTGAVLENERSSKRSLLLGLGTTIVMVLSTAITWPLHRIVPSYLQTMTFVVVVLAVVELFHLVAKQSYDNYCKADFVKFAINGAVLGLCLHNTHESYLTAIGKPGRAALISVGTAFVFPVVLLGALWYFGLDGIWFNFVGVNVFAATLSAVLLIFLSREMRKAEKRKEESEA